MRFVDRHDAGRRLAARLDRFRGKDTWVLALPRGGVPVAHEIARALDAPLDLLVVRKLGVPFHPELAMGAIGEGGIRILDDEVVRAAGVSAEEILETELRERLELARRATRYRQGRATPVLTGRTAIIVDDGIATGSTARAACEVARAQGAARIVLAAPVGPVRAARELASAADEVVLLHTPRDFVAIGQFYDDFGQTTDEEVVELLASEAAPAARIDAERR